MFQVLSIQSFVSFGHAGNASAMFPLQRAGVNVLPVHTVLFSNHTGYETVRGPLIPASDIAAIVRGIDERGALAHTDAILSGYLGSTEAGRVVLDAAALTKRRNPEAVLLADPVMGDVDTGLFCQEGIPEYFRHEVVPHADIMTPNLFELNLLLESESNTLREIVAAARELSAAGPGIVVVTSAAASDLSTDKVHMVAVCDGGAYLVTTPLLPRNFVGTGDLTSAMFLAAWLKGRDVAEALGRAASIVYSVLEASSILGGDELQLIATQEQIVNPVHLFTAHQID